MGVDGGADGVGVVAHREQDHAAPAELVEVRQEREGRTVSETAVDDHEVARAVVVRADAGLGPARGLDHVAYLRFASVYKGFEDLADFEREVVELQKTTAPKRRLPN